MISAKQSWLRLGLLLVALVIPALLVSAERRNAKKPSDPAAEAPSVEMFAAIESKEIEVKLIPKDSAESKVLIKNNTKQPLNVKLPEAFAGVPVLAQPRPGAAGGAGRGAPGGTNQGFGGGMGGMGMGGMGGGMWSVPPEQVGQFKVATVCLEHGKKEPRPNVPYDIRPLESLSTKPGVKELLVALGKGKLSQRATQAAAWHLANGLSWEQLASKRIEHLNGTSEPWFSREEIQEGMQIAGAALAQADENAKKSPSAGGSLNRSVSQTE